MLPEIWTSIFHHPELDLLLVVYVDDFKLAEPAGSLDKGWELIGKVVEIDAPEPFGRYFGCHHIEKNKSDCLKRNTLLITCLRVLRNTRVFALKEGLRTTGSMMRTRKRGHAITCSPESAFSALRSK